MKCKKLIYKQEKYRDVEFSLMIGKRKCYRVTV